ncbi:MAG: hypothetical protein JOZ67_10435 [Gammaproteobacteria bacterium]|nr:hypothetical protein [Gammaproteobacteria bacterium]MBV9696454.1 hypothetical protein [Gammaproteobacteria bacterium]
MPTNDPRGKDQYPRGSRARPRTGKRKSLDDHSAEAEPPPKPPEGAERDRPVEEARRAYDDKSR